MTSQTVQPVRVTSSHWLKSYYFARAGVSIVWVAAAFTLGSQMPQVAAALLVAYPAWDALANFVDAKRSGGLTQNGSQAFNVGVSAITTMSVAFALGQGMHAVLAVFGVWAILAGLFQLITGVRRWKAGGQWAMVLSGAQSVLAGAFFVKQATSAAVPGITDIAPYAAFGAFYFLASAIWLTVADMRRRSTAFAAE